MKIGLMRASQAYDIDWIYGSAASKAVELRLGILEGLVNLGHQVVILSDIPKSQLYLLRPENYRYPEKTMGYNYSFMKGVTYEPETFPENIDLIIIEGSIDNVHFGINQLKRMANILQQYSGPCVIFHHGDQNCSVPIGEIKRAQELGPKEGSEFNYRNVFQGVPWRPEQWHLWTPGNPHSLVNLPSARRGYNFIPKENVKQITLGYSPTFDTPRNSAIEWDKAELVYVGDQRSPDRTERMAKLYGNTCEHCDTLLFGEWKDIPENFNYRGFVPGFGIVYSLLATAEGSITVVREWCTRFELPTTRTIQTIRAGLITFCDKQEQSYMTKYLNPFYFINSHEEYHEKVNAVHKGLGDNLEFQKSYLKPWTETLSEVL